LKPDTYHIDPFLSVVGLDGKIQTLVKEWGSAETAAWLPDGKSVVFMGTPHGKPIGTKNDLWVLPLTGAQPECRTKKVAPGVGGGLQGDMTQGIIRNPSVFVEEQGKYAFIQVQTGGEIHVNRVALQGPEEVTPLDQGLHAAVPLDVKSGKLLYLVSQSSDPMNLFIKDLKSGKTAQFTHLNDEFLSRHLLPTVERLLFKGEDGVPVEGWLMKPVSGQTPYPTVLYIHGGPHSAFGMSFSFDFHMLSGAGFAVLFINQRASKGYDDAFATAIKGDWGHLDYTDLMAGLDLAIEKGLVDPDRLGVCGLSGGGNLSCWIVGHTRRFKAAVPENPVTNWVSFYGVSDIGPWFSVEELGGTPYEIPDVYRRCSPITYANNCTTPTLFVQGEADYRCPAEQSEQFYTVLKANGCVAEMLRLPGSPHAGSMEGEPIIRRAQNEALLGWMKKYVLGKE
jgi:dipeptidyl aminopeptidase/acylaminoacyl peptidase